MLMLIFLMATSAVAGNIQYRLDTMHVTGATDLDIAKVTGYAVITIAESVDDITWPIPSGCPTGLPEWTMVTDPETVAVDGTGLAVRTGLTLFSTTSSLLPGCHRVATWRQLRHLVEGTIIETVNELDMTAAINELNTPLMVLCPATNDSQNCIDWRASMAAISVRYPSRVQFRNLSADILTLINDAFAFKTLQSW